MAEPHTATVMTQDNRSLLQQSNLTTSQLYIWMGQQLRPDLPLYNMALSFTIEEALSPVRFQEAFDTLVAHTDALRTVVMVEKGIPQQRVLPQLAYTVTEHDFSAEGAPSAAAAAWCQQRSQINFKLDECLFDSALLKLDDTAYIWYFNQHHLVTDAWSTTVLYERLAMLYRDGVAAAVPSEWPQYADYVAAERSAREEKQAVAARQYWQEKGQRAPERLRFYGNPGPAGAARTHRVSLPLGRQRSESLRALAATPEFRTISADLSLFNLVCVILFAWLHRVCDSTELSVLTPSHNRHKPAFRDMAGLFIEIFPLHATVQSDETFLSLAKAIRGETFAFLQYAIPGASSNEANRENTVLLNFINRQFGAFAGAPMHSDWVHPEHGDAAHSLRVQVHDFDDSGELMLHFDFHCDVFDGAAQQWATRHFTQIFDACLENPAQIISEVSLLDESERALRAAFNPTITPIADGASVLQRFRDQVANVPDAIAASWGNDSITYGDLDRRANQLANYLTQRGIGPEKTVAILLERSVEFLVAIWATLKAGAAYIPLDASYPVARVVGVLKASGAPHVISTTPLSKELPEGPWSVTWLDRDAHAIAACDAEDRGYVPGSDALAYIIYTSGSTGAPKGVMISHGALANYIHWASEQYTQGARRTFPFFTSPAFDLTVTSLFVPLTTGGEIAIYPPHSRTGDLSILDVIEDDRVDIIKLTPAHLGLLLNVDTPGTRVAALILGGEDLKTSLARAARDRFGPDLTIYNEYGPTEATVGCMIHPFDAERDTGISVPLGIPVANTHIYILDERLQPTATGAVGELYIAGAGLATGYLNAPELSEAAFLPNPFLPGQRMYKTGDRARWQADGQLVFLGRQDGQVKVRGARIELHEIETALRSLEGVEACNVRVVAQDRSDAELPDAAYCVACGLPSNVPGTTLDEDGVCNVCRDFNQYRHEADRYFMNMDALEAVFADVKAHPQGNYDCMMLLSGGKDSTYALGRLQEMGLRPLVFSLDNGYISEEAKVNIRRVVDTLGLDLEFASTPAMNAVFVDSLQRFSNVCNGCFKVIYTLALTCARNHGIRHIVTGLSRGQIFDTRLKDFYRHGIYDPAEIDAQVLLARKAYHRAKDAVSRHMDVDFLADGAVLDEVQFVDFYRYCDVSLDEVYDFLGKRIPWVRPSDTGRSTNCLINEVGIFIHKRDRKHHNYASPYSWDVRLGHKTRDAAMKELDDEIVQRDVQQILDEIGYAKAENHAQSESRLVACYVADESVSPSSVRSHLERRLPIYMVPQVIIPLDAFPLTINGKIDHQALPVAPVLDSTTASGYVAPRTSTERTLVALWQEMLGVPRVGIDDNFIALGGDSIRNIQTVARANEMGLAMSPRQLFDYPTIRLLAEALATEAAAQREEASESTLTPRQHRVLEQTGPAPNGLCWEFHYTVEPGTDTALLAQTWEKLWSHFPQKGPRFTPPPPLRRDGSSPESEAAALLEQIDVASGALIRGALVAAEGHETQIVVVVHALLLDVAGWTNLCAEWQRATQALQEGRPFSMEDQAASRTAQRTYYTQMSRRLSEENGSAFWVEQATAGETRVPCDHSDKAAEATTLLRSLDATATASLFGEGNNAYGTRPHELLCTALGDTLCRWMGTESAVVDIQLPQTGYTDKNTPGMAGIAIEGNIAPVLLRGGASRDPGMALTTTKDYLRALPEDGAAYSVLRYLAPDASYRDRLRALPRPEVLFQFIDSAVADAIAGPGLRPVALPRLQRDPANPRPHPLMITAGVLDGTLHVEWEYNPAWHHEETIAQQADAFMDTLGKLLQHSLSQTERTQTTSDFPMAGLNATQFQKLAKALKKPKPRTGGPQNG